MAKIDKWIRRYQYISDYYQTVYEYYSHTYQGFPCTYYSIDWDNSVYDKNLMAATYEKNGIGELSGLKFKKILMVPAYGLEAINPTYNAGERGVTLHESEYTNITIPSVVGINPSEWDVVHFHQDFMHPERPIDTDPLFVVNNITPATYGTQTHNQCRLTVSPSLLEDLEKQISSHWFFLEFTKTIHRLDTAQVLLKLETKNELLSERLQSTFHTTGFYLQESE